jgi:hypothetical protein
LLWNEIRRQAEFKKRQGGGTTDDPQTLAAIRLREWGRTPTRLLLEAADSGRVSRPDLLEYMSLSSGQVAEVRQRLSSGNIED